MSSSWPHTPKMRTICEFQQDGSTIVTLGWDIWYLGLYMESAADIMQNLADGSDGQQGKAVDELREKVGDAHVQLHLASEMYMPIGTALKEYGAEVRDTISTQVNTRFQTAHEAWVTYQGLPGDKEGRDYFLGIGKPEDGSTEAEQHKAEDDAKKQAWDDWVEAAQSYDLAHDTWEEAWDTAVDKCDDGFSDDLKDSRWEKVKKFLNGLAEVLSWAGLIVGILALIVGGPILAAIAAAIAVAALIVTVVLALAGDKTLGDVLWATVDIIPFGKAGKLFHRGGAASFGNDMLKNFKVVKLDDALSGASKLNPRTWKLGGVYDDGWQAVKKFDIDGFGGNKGFADVMHSLLTGKSQKGWDDLRLGHFNFDGMPTHLPSSEWVAEFARRNASATWDEAHSLVGHVFKVEGWHNKIDNAITGDDDKSWRDSNPVTKLIW